MAETANSKQRRARKAGVMGVYAIRNTVNGKCYVGSSCHIAQRWRQHRHVLKAGSSRTPRLQAAWTKYGGDAFVFEIVEVVADRSKLGEREQHWLDTLDTFKTGYNATPIVDALMLMPRPAEWGRRVSEAKRGKKIKVSVRPRHSPEHRQAISEALKRHHAEHPRKFKRLTPEHRRNIGLGLRRYQETVERVPFTEQHRANMSAAARKAWAKRKSASDAEE